MKGQELIPIVCACACAAPTLLAGSLQLYPTGSPASAITSGSTQGEDISFRGTNFGNQTADVSVTYGPFPCTFTTFPLADNRIICTSSPGDGQNFKFLVKVGVGLSVQQVVSDQ
jgi:hypothetical protein